LWGCAELCAAVGVPYFVVSVPVGRQICYQTMLKLFSRPLPKRIVEDILCFTRHHHWAVEPLERSSRLECADGIQPAKQFQDVNAPMEQPPATGAASTFQGAPGKSEVSC